MAITVNITVPAPEPLTVSISPPAAEPVAITIAQARPGADGAPGATGAAGATGGTGPVGPTGPAGTNAEIVILSLAEYMALDPEVQTDGRWYVVPTT